MNILIAVHHFPPTFSGGAEWRAYRTAKALQQRGHTVSVVCVENITYPTDKNLVWKDEIFQEVSVRRLYFNLASAPDIFSWKYYNPWISKNIRSMLKEKNIDILHLVSGYLMSSSVLEAARQEGIATVLSLTDFWFLCPRISLITSQNKIKDLPITPQRCAQCLGEEKRRYRWLGYLFPKVMKYYWSKQFAQIEKIEQRQKCLFDEFSKINTVISPSNFLKNFHEQAGAINPGMVFSRQGYEFSENSDSFTQKTKSKILRLGYIGQFVWKKGIHVILKALQLLPDTPLVFKLYGNQNEFPDYTKYLHNLSKNDPRIHWEGIFPRENISGIFQNLDMIIVPSIWYENSPNVILESFAHKTPVLASNLGGMAELVKSGVNGMLFDYGDETDLSRQIKILANDPAVLPALTKGIGPVKSLTEEIDEIENIYRQVLDH